MYCKICGADNPDSANYCFNDGTLLKSYPVKYQKKGNTSTFCSNCGGSVSPYSNYCQNCGEGLIKYGHEKSNVPKVSIDYPKEFTPKLGKLPAIRFESLKKAIIPALIAIVVIFVLSFSMMKTTEKLYDSLMKDALQGNDISQMIGEINSEDDISLPDPSKLVGVTDILMLANLQNPNVTFKASGDLGFIGGNASVDMLAKNGFMIYLLIPFIGLFIAGIFAGRKTRGMNLLNRLSDSAGIAIIYAVFCTIISLFAGFSYDTKFNQMGVNLSLNIDTDYSFFKTLLLTLLIGFSFSSLGILFSTNFRKITGNLVEMIPSGEAIHQAIAVPVRGIFILFVIFFIFLSGKVAEFKEQFNYELKGTPLEFLIDKSYGLISNLALQLGTYAWNLLHMSSLTLNIDDESDKGSLAYHLFSGLKPGGQLLDDSDVEMIAEFFSSSDIGLYLNIALLIPIALFIWAGIRIARQPNVIKNLVVFSIVYAVIMMGIASFSDIGFSFGGKEDGDTENIAMMLGFSPFATFFGSLIISFIFAYAGTWIPKLRSKQ